MFIDFIFILSISVIMASLFVLGCLLVLVAVVHVLPPHTAPLLATLRGWLATLFMKLWLGTSLGGRLWLGTSLGAAS